MRVQRATHRINNEMAAHLVTLPAAISQLKTLKDYESSMFVSWRHVIQEHSQYRSFTDAINNGVGRNIYIVPITHREVLGLVWMCSILGAELPENFFVCILPASTCFWGIVRCYSFKFEISSVCYPGYIIVVEIKFGVFSAMRILAFLQCFRMKSVYQRMLQAVPWASSRSSFTHHALDDLCRTDESSSMQTKMCKSNT